MSEIRLPTGGTGDALSQMLQVAARQAGLGEWRWSGDGATDVQFLLSALSGARAANAHLMRAMSDIVNIPEVAHLQNTNESVAARIALLVLRSRALMDAESAAAKAFREGDARRRGTAPPGGVA